MVNREWDTLWVEGRFDFPTFRLGLLVFCVIYAQVYVGIHYPLDVIGGAIIGIIIGSITGKFFARRFGFHAIPLSQ